MDVAIMYSLSRGLLTVTVGLALIAILLSGCAGSKQAQVSITPEAETTQLQQEPVIEQPAIDTSFLVTADTSSIPEKQWGWIKNEWINVREGANTQSIIAARLERGSRVELLEQVDDWWHVELEDGNRGYIHVSLVHFDEYLDPWTHFRMSCRLADTSLSVINGVSQTENSDAPEAYLRVKDEWYLLSHERRKLTAQQGFFFWQKCLEEAGFKLAGATLIFHDEDQRELAKVTRSGSGAVDIKLTEY